MNRDKKLKELVDQYGRYQYQRRRRTLWSATRKTFQNWRELYFEWKLYLECLVYYIWHFKRFKKEKIKFIMFHQQMEYFLLVDPHIKQIKSLWQAMEKNKNDLQKIMLCEHPNCDEERRKEIKKLAEAFAKEAANTLNNN